MRNRPTTDERRLSSTGFSRLLARLGPDSDEAAAQYERLRVTLEKFFDWHGAWPPEECADETLDRLTRKLESEIEIVDVRSYALGIARLVLLEWQRRPATLSSADRPEIADLSVPDALEDDDEPLRACFDRCLAALPDDSRTLVLDTTSPNAGQRSTTAGVSRRSSGFPRVRFATASSAFGIVSSGACTRAPRLPPRSESTPPCGKLPMWGDPMRREHDSTQLRRYMLGALTEDERAAIEREYSNVRTSWIECAPPRTT